MERIYRCCDLVFGSLTLHSKTWLEHCHTDGGGCTLSVGREVNRGTTKADEKRAEGRYSLLIDSRAPRRASHPQPGPSGESSGKGRLQIRLRQDDLHRLLH